MRPIARADTILLALLICAGTGITLIAKSSGSIGLHYANAHAAALVNGVAIFQGDFDRAAKLAHVTQAGSRRALREYLIDEELLVQHALEIGLLADDPMLHRTVVRATMDAAIRNAERNIPTTTNDWIHSANISIAAIELEQCRISGIRRREALGADQILDPRFNDWETSCARF
jgi:hypothetical protein